MAKSSLRREFLLATQNSDGGWGYFPGRESWLEPTGWSALALHGDPAADRAYALVKRWQNPDGSARPAAAVDSAHWSAALILALGALRRDESAVKPAVRYLLESSGIESGFIMRVMQLVRAQESDRNPKFEGWPWRPGASAWIEPTVHGITALRLAAQWTGDGGGEIRARLDSAQNLIWHQRCKDGGWNYGARRAREVWLESFPETTALAAIGLYSTPHAADALDAARRLVRDTASPLAKAWLALGLRLNGAASSDGPPPALPPAQDIMIASIEELASPGGNWRLLAGAKGGRA